MAVTYVTASDRDAWLTVAGARRLDVRHGLLAVTSLVAVLAITLAYQGRVAADGADAPREGVTIDLNAVENSAQLDRWLRPVYAESRERRIAATQLYEFISSRRDRGDSLPNVGAVRPLLSSEQLAALKPFAVVRTAQTHEQHVVVWAAVYVSCVWMVSLFWWFRGIRGDYLLLSSAHLLTALGFAALLSRQDPLRDTELFVRYAQLTSSGLILFALISALDFRKVARAGLTYLPLVGALALSAVLILFGRGPSGSNAKVNLGPVQPVEFIRLLLALFLAGYFARRWEVLRDVRSQTVREFRLPRWLNLPRVDYVLPLVAGVAAALVFFFLQKDLGPALFLSCVFLMTYAIARNRVGLAVAGFATLIAGFYVGYALNISSTLTARVAMWQSTWDNSVRGGEQIAQSIWSLSTGGLFGTGLGLGDTGYVPAGFTDLMLASVGEELGFVGLVVGGCPVRDDRRARFQLRAASGRRLRILSRHGADAVPHASRARHGRRDAWHRPADRRGDAVLELWRFGDAGQLHRVGCSGGHSRAVVDARRDRPVSRRREATRRRAWRRSGGPRCRALQRPGASR